MSNDRKPNERLLAPVGECDYCDGIRERGETFFPAHNPSPFCGGVNRTHCTCDSCF